MYIYIYTYVLRKYEQNDNKRKHGIFKKSLRKYEHNNNRSKHGTFKKSKIREVTRKDSKITKSKKRE